MNSKIELVDKEGVVVDSVMTMNGRSIEEVKNSYVLRCTLEEALATFNSLNEEQRVYFCERFDKLFSELFI